MDQQDQMRSFLLNRIYFWLVSATFGVFPCSFLPAGIFAPFVGALFVTANFSVTSLHKGDFIMIWSDLLLYECDTILHMVTRLFYSGVILTSERSYWG